MCIRARNVSLLYSDPDSEFSGSQLINLEYFYLELVVPIKSRTKTNSISADKDYTSPDHKDRSKKKRKRKHLKRAGLIIMDEDSK